MLKLIEEVIELIMLSLSIGVMSLIITKAEVARPVRSAFERKSEWLGKLIHCPLCTSVWLAFAVALLFQPYLIHSKALSLPFVNSILDWFVSAMLMAAIANQNVWLTIKAYHRVWPPE